MSKKQELENKIEKLEKDKIAYLEVDNKAGARRIEKQIERTEMELELLDLNNIKKELKIYKEVVREYPALQRVIQIRMEK